MKLKYGEISFPIFPGGNYTEGRNLEGGLPHMLGLRNHYDFLKDRSCRRAVMLLLLRSQARWRLNRKLELNKENNHPLDLEELWLYLPSAQHPRHKPALANTFSFTNYINQIYMYSHTSF